MEREEYRRETFSKMRREGREDGGGRGMKEDQRGGGLKCSLGGHVILGKSWLCLLKGNEDKIQSSF